MKKPGKSSKPPKSESKRRTQRDPLLEHLGQRIREVRQEKGFNQEAFAAVAGIDRAYYGGIERGERNVTAISIVRIASALDVEPGALFPDLSTLRGLLPTARRTG